MKTFKIRQKWRPPLALIVYAVLLAVMSLPVAIILWFRTLDEHAPDMGALEAALLCAAFGLTLVVAYVLTRTITRPIETLITMAHQIDKGNHRPVDPLQTYGTREIAVLSQSFLDLAGRLVDRSDYVRSFAAHVSHELKSPLTAIRGAAELLRDDEADMAMTPAEQKRFLGHIIQDADRLDRLLGRLRELAQAEMPVLSGETGFDAIENDLRHRFPALGLMIADTPDRIALPLETATIVFGHLADNALRHGATILDIRITTQDHRASILIADNGSGIAEGNRSLIFQPFFSTRREQGGTGMGLDIVRAMLSVHGGTIALVTSPNQPGAAFEITLPAVSQ